MTDRDEAERLAGPHREECDERAGCFYMCDRDERVLGIVALIEAREVATRDNESLHKILRAIAEETWMLGEPGGDRSQTLANWRAIRARLHKAEADWLALHARIALLEEALRKIMSYVPGAHAHPPNPMAGYELIYRAAEVALAPHVS